MRRSASEGLDAIANGKGMELSDDASVIVLYSNAGERSARAVRAYGIARLCECLQHPRFVLVAL